MHECIMESLLSARSHHSFSAIKGVPVFDAVLESVSQHDPLNKLTGNS